MLLQFEVVAQSYDSKEDTKLDCIRGVWQPVNSGNPDLTEYMVNDSIFSLAIAFDKNMNLVFSSFLVNGFMDLGENTLSMDTIHVSELRSNGRDYVWFYREDLTANSTAKIEGYQRDFLCHQDAIEMTDNNMTIWDRLAFLPYEAFQLLQNKIDEFNQNFYEEVGPRKFLKKSKVVASKTYFHNSRSESTKRKAFVVEGDEVFIDRIAEDWIRVAYEGKNSVTKGWLKKEDLEIIE